MVAALEPVDVRAECSLPQGWASPIEFADAVDLSGSRIALSGFSATGPRGENVTGSAAAVEGTEPPVTRSYCELLERVSVVTAMNAPAQDLVLLDRDGEHVGRAYRADLFPVSDTPERWRPSLSNGVALHTTWREACDRAAYEVVERDRVLRSWYGESRPLRRPLPLHCIPEGLRRLAVWAAYEVPPGERAVGPSAAVAIVLGTPLDGATPLSYGFAARANGAQAIDAAALEAVQRFSFLFGEAIPAEVPAHAPTPDYHQEFYLHPPARRLLVDWLEESTPQDAPVGPRRGVVERAPLFVDLTPAHLRGAVYVAKAVWPEAEPLVFGNPAPHRAATAAHRRVHPIA